MVGQDGDEPSPEVGRCNLKLISGAGAGADTDPGGESLEGDDLDDRMRPAEIGVVPQRSEHCREKALLLTVLTLGDRDDGRNAAHRLKGANRGVCRKRAAAP
jgi:hypothetical protein